MRNWTEDNGIFTLRMTETIPAPIDRCFRLTCSIALVQEELGMKPVHGRTSGLVQPGDTVRWEGWQLGMRHFHVSRISGYVHPTFLQDSMLGGRFRTFQHDHHLKELPNGVTELHDELHFSLPYGQAGRLVARYIMVPHILRLMRSRFHRIRRIATTEAWKNYLAEDGNSI
ncbi:SRPBCC family protein [Terriglobus sp. ADX1]|uniref:SRPBCC family protein n=1 Tax=Terriglobus sp. ADX1 TaxID=2794063 RepID=UPI002FE52830